jgi:hypothetical protein
VVAGETHRYEEGVMKGRVWQARNAIFYLLVALAVAVLSMEQLMDLSFSVLALLVIAFGLFGLVLVVLTARLREARMQKIFFMLTGASAAGIPISAILHNLVYRLVLTWFGEGFWERHTPFDDEPFFFILAVFVCPTLFLIGILASIVLLIKARIAKRANLP